jgi:hypothetical protein
MKISYNIPTQTVTLEIEPADMKEIGADVRENIKTVFSDLVAKLRDQMTGGKDKLVVQ